MKKILNKIRSLLTSSEIPSPNRSGWKLTRGETVVWGCFIVLSFITLWYHEPWRDEAQGFLLARDLSIPGLFAHMNHESQFILWYLFSWPFVHLLHFNMFALSTLHWMIACFTAFLIIRHAPFRLIARAAILFSMPFFFEYTVITRHYQIGIFLLTVLLVFWKHRCERPLTFAAILAVAASSNLPIWGCLGSMCLVILIECIIARRFGWRIWCAMLICALGFGAAALEIYNWHGGFGSAQIVSGASFSVKMEPMRYLYHACYFYAQTLKLPMLGGLIVTIIAIAYFSRCWRALVFYLANTLYVFALMYYGQFHSMRHVGFFLVGAVVACWLESLERIERRSSGMCKSETRLCRLISRTAWCMAALIFAEEIILSVLFMVSEILYPFSHGRATAEFIRKRYPEGVLVCCYTARQTVSVLAYLDNQSYIFDRSEMGSFSKWGKVKPKNMMMLSDEIFKILPPESMAVLAVFSGNEHPNNAPPNYYLRYFSGNEEKPLWSPYGETFYIYEIFRPSYLGIDISNVQRSTFDFHTLRFPTASPW